MPVATVPSVAVAILQSSRLLPSTQPLGNSLLSVTGKFWSSTHARLHMHATAALAATSRTALLLWLLVPMTVMVALLIPICLSRRAKAEAPDAKSRAPEVPFAVLAKRQARLVRAKASQELLCPHLFVPPDCQCDLVLPLRLQVSSEPSTIWAMDGTVVMQVVRQELWTPAPMPASSFLSSHSPSMLAASHENMGSQLILQTAQGEMLAKCWTQTYQEFFFHRCNDEYFATLSCGSSRHQYKLQRRNGSDVAFSGTLRERTLKAVDSTGEVLASADKRIPDFVQQGSHFCTHLSSGADVGLIICSLLCIQILAAPTHDGK